MIARPAHVSVLLVGHWQSAMQKSWPSFLSCHSPTGNGATYSKKVSESHGAWKPRTGMRLEGDRGRKTMLGALAPEVGREGNCEATCFSFGTRICAGKPGQVIVLDFIFDDGDGAKFFYVLIA